MSVDKPVPRILQQQPQHESDPQQQRSGATDFQSRGQAQGESGSQVEGEGSYSATRDYQKNIKEYLDKADVEADAEAAKPRSQSEAKDLEDAEREGKSHSRGER
ncbi:MAG: hypothetical protein K0R58_1599 [Ramlibacter sp.]|nr:hypothetical protein [Ramlibacter sp.]